jgi:tetratricopeptide (TPR) repeat protein
MAEGMLGGMLGGEEEKPEVEAAEPLAGAEAFAAAVAAKLAGNDLGVARKTEEFLDKQSRLLDTQNKHLEEEHGLRMAHLSNQLREENVRRFGLRLRVCFQLFVALVATVFGIIAVTILHDAITSRSVVIEAFEVPPALTARGISGTVVAGAVLDELGRLQRATLTSSYASAKRELSSAWTSEVKLEVPDTGISIGDVSKALKHRFGHDLHIGGNVVETEAGSLAVTVRGDGIEPRVFAGPAADLKKLTTTATEYVYAQSQPVLWAIYLEGESRYEEEVAFIKSVFAKVNPADRPYLLNSWGNCLNITTKGRHEEALKLYRAAVELKPDYWAAASNVDQVLWFQGKEEEAWRNGERIRASAGGRPGRAPESYYGAWDALTWNLGPALRASEADADQYAGIGTGGSPDGPFIAQLRALLHDPAAAQLAIDTNSPEKPDPTVVAGIHLARGFITIESDGVAAAVNEMELFDASFSTPQVDLFYLPWRCWVAPVEEAAGHPDKADAVLKEGGTYVDCYRFRADILEHRGDWKSAQEWYTKAVELAPDLPAGYYSWGIALAKHGDLVGADAKLEDANQRGPHWADPLKAWGDVLLKQGKTKEALAKYDEALKYAPNWEQLKEARETVAKQNK